MAVILLHLILLKNYSKSQSCPLSISLSKSIPLFLTSSILYNPHMQIIIYLFFLFSENVEEIRYCAKNIEQRSYETVWFGLKGYTITSED